MSNENINLKKGDYLSFAGYNQYRVRVGGANRMLLNQRQDESGDMHLVVYMPTSDRVDEIIFTGNLGSTGQLGHDAYQVLGRGTNSEVLHGPISSVIVKKR